MMEKPVSHAEFVGLKAFMREMHEENKTTLREIKADVEQTNGRVRKAEVAIAVLKFAVYTIGGSLLLAGLQVIVARLS